MNQIAFAKAAAFTLGSGIGKDLGEEGGFVDNIHDHGGRTNRGITQHAYDEFRASHAQPFADVKDITEAEVTVFYQGVWMAAHCDDMSLELAVAHFDWSVNHGCSGALETLQAVLLVEVDGNYGPRTRAALVAQDQHSDLWREYNRERRDWYQGRIKTHPDQAVFIRGWLGRVDRLDAYIETL